MKLNNLILVILLITINNSVFGQKYIENYSNIYKKIETYQFTNQDSCKYYLDVLNNYRNNIPDTLYAKLLNDYGIYYGMHDKKEIALSYFYRSIKVVPNNNKYKALGYKNIGNVYKIEGDYNKSISFFRKSNLLFKKLGDEKGQIRTLGEISSNYFYLTKYDLALQTSLQVIEKLERLHDTKFLAIQRMRLGNIYLILEKNQNAILAFNKCLKEFGAQKDEKRNYYRTMLNLGDCYVKSNDPEKAKEYFQKSIAGLLKEEDLESANIARSKLGNLYVNESNSEKAIANLKPAFEYLLSIKSPSIINVATNYILSLVKTNNLSDCKNIINNVAINKKNNFNDAEKLYYFETLILFYRKTNDKINELDALRKAFILKGKLDKFENIEKAKEIAAKYDTKLLEQKNKNLNLENNLLKTKSWILILLIFSILVLFGYLYEKYHKKIRVQKKIAEMLGKEKVLLEKQANIEKQNYDLANEVLSIKEREITALNLEMLNLHNNITTILKNHENSNNLDILKKKINSIFTNRDYWKEFELKFTKIHPDFSKNLIKTFPNLTKKDIEFCTLIKLKLSNKEIASLTQISYESVISKKYMLRKKTNINSENEFIKIIEEL
ncbi:MAG: transcriptional regulator [Flavobacteriaceae bacterium]|nr:transcriptional regulator [Flavobacteriaceae bacterium]